MRSWSNSSRFYLHHFPIHSYYNSHYPIKSEIIQIIWYSVIFVLFVHQFRLSIQYYFHLFPSCSHHVPIIFPSFSHHFPIIFPFPIMFPSFSHHVPIIFPSFSHHFPIIFPSIPSMFSTCFTWIAHHFLHTEPRKPTLVTSYETCSRAHWSDPASRQSRIPDVSPDQRTWSRGPDPDRWKSWSLEPKKHGSLVMSPCFTSPNHWIPLGINGLLDGYYFWWCPIYPSHGTFNNPWKSEVFPWNEPAIFDDFSLGQFYGFEVEASMLNWC